MFVNNSSTHHLEKCRGEISTCRRWRLKLYREAFTGTSLVDWLLGVGLARDRIEAVQYAGHLLEGRVIRHVEHLYHYIIFMIKDCYIRFQHQATN
ncbi:hypothetical protein L9F63_023952 [Diploptera punctata]|uniref:DEP domain-containing protein n=1 Tax=Diploptera punctata TaxID=6984 RepID=A0AAD8E8I9_DIPPU|nr:hypothetical protein L9F63_023952 [Diploptera punctata]